MIITIFISKKKLEGWDILYTFFSFPCGAYEDEDLSYNLRSRSKGIFSLIFIFSMGFVVLSTNTDVFNDFGFRHSKITQAKYRKALKSTWVFVRSLKKMHIIISD